MGCVYTVCNGEVIDADHHNTNKDLAGQATKNALMSGIYSTCIAFCGSYGDLTPYDDAVVDIYSDSGGYLDTVNTGNTTAGYDSDNDVYVNSDICVATTSDFCTCVFCDSGDTCNISSCCECLQITATINDTTELRTDVCNFPCTGSEININSYDYVDLCLNAYGNRNNNPASYFVITAAEFEYAGISFFSERCVNVNFSCSKHIEFCKTAACQFDYYENGTCCGNITCECIDYKFIACLESGSGSGGASCGCVRVCLTQNYAYAYADRVIEIDAQSFDSTTNAIFPTLELSEGSRDDITVDVEDGSSNVLACDVPLDSFGNFSTCCPCVLVKYKLGDCDLKMVKAHGYKVMSL